MNTTEESCRWLFWQNPHVSGRMAGKGAFADLCFTRDDIAPGLR